MRCKLVSILTTAVTISVVLPSVSIGAELEIKQEGYLFTSEIIQDVYAETFLISTSPDEDGYQVAVEHDINEGLKGKSAIVSSPPDVAFTNPIVVYFPIDSFEIDPFWKIKMLSGLEELKMPKNTPLIVTGFTCQKGSADFNNWLSEERAKTVAELLTNEGYTIAKIEGRGDLDLVSENYYPLNRRVEIKALKQ